MQKALGDFSLINDESTREGCFADYLREPEEFKVDTDDLVMRRRKRNLRLLSQRLIYVC